MVSLPNLPIGLTGARARRQARENAGRHVGRQAGRQENCNPPAIAAVVPAAGRAAVAVACSWGRQQVVAFQAGIKQPGGEAAGCKAVPCHCARRGTGQVGVGAATGCMVRLSVFIYAASKQEKQAQAYAVRAHALVAGRQANR